MIDREIVETASGVFDRIAAAAHHVLDEPIGLDDGAARVVHETCLDRAPQAAYCSACSRDSDLQRERLDPALPLPELVFGFRRRARRLQHAVVLGPEARAQRGRLAPLHQQPHCDAARTAIPTTASLIIIWSSMVHLVLTPLE